MQVAPETCAHEIGSTENRAAQLNSTAPAVAEARPDTGAAAQANTKAAPPAEPSADAKPAKAKATTPRSASLTALPLTLAEAGGGGLRQGSDRQQREPAPRPRPRRQQGRGDEVRGRRQDLPPDLRRRAQDVVPQQSHHDPRRQWQAEEDHARRVVAQGPRSARIRGDRIRAGRRAQGLLQSLARFRGRAAPGRLRQVSRSHPRQHRPGQHVSLQLGRRLLRSDRYSNRTSSSEPHSPCAASRASARPRSARYSDLC